MKKLLRNSLWGGALALLPLLGVQTAKAQDTEEIVFNCSSIESLTTYIPGLPSDVTQWTQESSNYRFSLDPLILNYEGYTVQIDKATASTSGSVYDSSNKIDIRIYNGNILTVTSAPGYQFESIDFNFESSTASNAKKFVLTAGQPGEFSDEVSKHRIWKNNTEESVTSLTCTTTATLRLGQINIIASKIEGTVTPTPQLPPLYITGSTTSPTWNPSQAETIEAVDGVYTYKFPENSTPQFKISTVKADWDTGFNANCIGLTGNNADVPSTNLNTELKLTKGLSGNIQLPIKDSYTLTIVNRDDNYYLTISTPGGEAPTYTPPTAVYVKGGVNEWKGNSTQPLALQNETPDENGNYIFSGVMPTLSGEFKICQSLGDDWNGINYGVGDSGSTTIISANQKVACTNNGGNISCGNTVYTNVTVIFTFNLEGTSYIELIAASTPTYPETLYIFGQVGELGGFSPTKGIASTETNVEDGIYTFKDLAVTDSGDGSGYFSFTSKLTDNNDGWSDIAAYRYGSTADNTEVILDQPLTLQSGEGSYKINPGTYTFVANLAEGQLTVSASTIIEPTPDDVVLYIVGDNINGEKDWDNGSVMTLNDDGTYTWTGTQLGGGFKFNDGKWDNGYNIGAGDEGNTITLGQALKVTNPSEANIVIPINTYIENPTVVLNLTENTVTVTGTSVSTAPYEPGDVIYLKGEFDNWGEGIAMTKNDEGKYVLTTEIAAPTENNYVAFKIDAGDDHWYGPFDGEFDVTLTSGVTTTLNMNPDSGMNNWYLQNWQGGEITFTVDWSEKTLSLLYTAPEIVEPTPELEEYQIYVYNSTSWENLYLYIWNNENTQLIGTWPGSKTEVKEIINDYEFLVWTIEVAEGTEENLIFNNNDGTQLKDLTVTMTEDLYLEVNDQEVTIIDPATFKPSSISSIGYRVEEGDAIYTIQGVRVDHNKLSKGIYIINGKKVIIK